MTETNPMVAFLKNEEKLNDERDERKRLEEALEFNRPLAAAYYMKDKLR
jgi:hypothetical protein